LADLVLAGPVSAVPALVRLDQAVDDLSLAGPFAAGTGRDGFVPCDQQLACQSQHYETAAGPLRGDRLGGD
jgi:hypothetical protein